MFSLWCIDWVECLYANQILCISVLRVASGPRVKLTGLKVLKTHPSPTPAVVYSTGRSKVVIPVLVLLFVASRFIRRGELFKVLPFVILFLYFSVLLELRLPRLGKRANLRALRTFVRFVLVWFCLFPLPLRVWDGLRLVNMALPVLNPYLFWKRSSAHVYAREREQCCKLHYWL